MKNFGEKIRKLRKQKDMTQEQLAEYLNISTQSVSKWETNLTLPDITLIPIIANIFDVSADVLLGIDITAKEKRIQEIIDHAGEYNKNENKAKSAEILRDGLKHYPNSYKIMTKLISVITCQKEIIEIGEKILAECTDDECRHFTIQQLCYAYSHIGETEKAEKLAHEFPPTPLSRDILLLSIYSGEKLFRKYQECIFTDLYLALTFIGCNTYSYDKIDKYDYLFENEKSYYTIEECIIVWKKIIAILEIIFENGNYDYQSRLLIAETYKSIAKFYVRLGDFENAIANLKLAAEHSIKNDEYYNSDDEHTALIFRGKKFSYNAADDKTNSTMQILNSIDSFDFDPIRQNANFIEIEENLKKYAKKDD